MKTRCSKCGETTGQTQCEIKEKIETRFASIRNNRGHMASLTQNAPFSKPRKGTENPAQPKTVNAMKIIKTSPMVSYSRINFRAKFLTNPNKSQQIAAQGNASL
ncbi:hypothetical protein TNIN_169651 [Trichonephila inaurata madagascariensis]|uniref:Uncharacterized protein n=1 Tax=Trichonephila inaurata madagascariensis TaxID=2747483 RepID=A0A8X6WWF4_9ARAC|nr:hypothetical protein TNIN_169651 [Trichonephila inaurata madagascariensis]